MLTVVPCMKAIHVSAAAANLLRPGIMEAEGWHEIIRALWGSLRSKPSFVEQEFSAH